MSLPTTPEALERALVQARENLKNNSWRRVTDEHDAAVERGELAHPDDGGGLEDDASFWAKP